MPFINKYRIYVLDKNDRYYCFTGEIEKYTDATIKKMIIEKNNDFNKVEIKYEECWRD